MPVFGLGTWLMGGDHRRNPQNDDEKDRQAIRNAIDSGITHIDTAEMYAEGHAEELVGEVLQDYDRNNILLVSKVWPEHLRFDDVLTACSKSLERLRTDYLDIYLIHAPNPEIPLSGTMKAFDRLLIMGLIKHIGVSNFSINSFKKAQRCTENKIVVNQLHYNLMIREVEDRGLLAFCQKEDVMLCAWRPVQKGIFSSKSFNILDKLSKKYNKTPLQIAINWLISQQNVITISKMRQKVHLKENIGAVGWNMKDEDIEILRKEFPDQVNRSDATSISII